MYHAYAMANSKGEPLGEDYYGIASYSKTELEICIAKTLSDPGFLANWDVFGACCTSEDPKDIYEFSTHVLTGKVEAVALNGVYDRTSYHVSVKENLKGHAPDEIVVVAFKDSLKIGESYLFLLSGYIDPENVTYTLAGVSAVFPPDY